MPVYDDFGIIPGAGFPVGHFLALPKYFRFQVDPMKLCLGHYFYSKFLSLFVFVKLSDPAAWKLNLKKKPTRIISFIFHT